MRVKLLLLKERNVQTRNNIRVGNENFYDVQRDLGVTMSVCGSVGLPHFASKHNFRSAVPDRFCWVSGLILSTVQERKYDLLPNVPL